MKKFKCVIIILICFLIGLVFLGIKIFYLQSSQSQQEWSKEDKKMIIEHFKGDRDKGENAKG